MTGDAFSLYLPRLDGACYQLFLSQLGKAFADDFIILIRDNAPAHGKKNLSMPDNLCGLALPAYSPQLNPVERFFLEFRRALANLTFASIEGIHQAISQVLAGFTADKERLELLTNFPWWWFAVRQLEDDMSESG
jgi:hypothetical protein